MEGSHLLEQAAAIVLAGGQGTRLFPLTESRCKPAVLFGGKYRLIDIPLSNAIHAKIVPIFVVAQQFGQELADHVQKSYSFHPSLETIVPETAQFLGTADAVRKNMKAFLQSDADYFFILSGDQLYNINFGKMLAFAQKMDADLVIGSLEVGGQEASRMGIMKCNDQREITSFIEKPQQPEILSKFVTRSGTYLASMGIYVFKREALESLLKEKGDDFGHHLIPEQIARGKTFSFLHEGYWADIGTIGSFFQASMEFLLGKHCLNAYDKERPILGGVCYSPHPILHDGKIIRSTIGAGSVIHAAEVIESVVGSNCLLERGVRLYRAVLIGSLTGIDTVIQERSEVANAILDEGCVIGRGVSLINRKGLMHWDGEGVCIRDGIIIVRRNQKIPDGYQL